jgi:hypothetical protein
MSEKNVTIKPGKIRRLNRVRRDVIDRVRDVDKTLTPDTVDTTGDPGDFVHPANSEAVRGKHRLMPD